MENMIINQCKKCEKKYKTKKSLEKHEKKCKVVNSKPSITIEETEQKENNYDVNMTFLDGNKVAVEVTKQEEDDEDGEQVLKEILKPKVSPSYQQEIDKLQDLIEMFKTLPIPEKAESKDLTISQLKNIIAILMTQSQNLIKEMKQMSRRNSYFKNNIMLASFVLDKCRLANSRQ